MLKQRAGRNITDRMATCLRVAPARRIPDMAEEIRTGLLTPPRTIPPKYFYDDQGSLLFDRICTTSEYYLTRTETALLARHGRDIMATTRPDQILELGSGISQKIRLLFDACEELSLGCTYAPFDYCEEMLIQAAERLAPDYEWLHIQPLLGDYHAGLGNLPPAGGVRLLAFLGSTIGNFTPDECHAFIQEIRQCLQLGDYILLGADRVKDTAVLNAAYNDADGITADFNLNILRVINHELNADFELKNFSHHAYFDEDKSQIEMYLISQQEQDVSLGSIGKSIHLAAGESILTEISRKYTTAELESLLGDNGFRILRHYTPVNDYFSLLLATVI